MAFGAWTSEETGDALVSIRATGMIVRVNMESGDIKWIFADPANVPEEMQKYLLAPADGTRYPYGQHAAQFLDDGTIAYHNNDVDFLAPDQHLSAFEGHYSSNEILDIDEDARTVRTLWTYDADKKILSKMSGSLEFLDNGHKLVSYGSAIKESAYSASNDIEIMDTEYIEALMMELGEDDQVLWRATFPSVIHKVYETTLYGADTSNLANYKVEAFKMANGQDEGRHLGEPVDIDTLTSDLQNAAPFDGTFSVYVNRALIDYPYKGTNEIQVLFVDEHQTATLYTYKETGEDLPIVNSGRYGIRIAGLPGKQKAYVCINGTWYDTARVFDFRFNQF